MDANSRKNGIVSFIIPGLGQYFNGDAKKGLIYFGIAILLHISIWFFMNNSLGSFIQILYHAYAGFDAYRN